MVFGGFFLVKFPIKKKKAVQAKENVCQLALSTPFVIPSLALFGDVTQLPSVWLGSKGTGSDWLS